MVEPGSQSGRGGNSKGASARSERYVELSLKGRWIALARAWLEDHQPCTPQQYFEAVTPLMPKHVYRSGHVNKVSQVALTKEALKVLVTKGTVCVNDDIYTTTTSCRKQGQVSVWRELATSIVNLNEVSCERGLTNKQKDAFRQWLRTNGYCSNGKGIFTKTGTAT